MLVVIQYAQVSKSAMPKHFKETNEGLIPIFIGILTSSSELVHSYTFLYVLLVLNQTNGEEKNISIKNTKTRKPAGMSP